MSDHVCTIYRGLPIWTSEDGRKFLCLCQIADGHLLNIISHLNDRERAFEKKIASDDNISVEEVFLLEARLDSMRNLRDYIRKEATRRGLAYADQE